MHANIIYLTIKVQCFLRKPKANFGYVIIIFRPFIPFK